MIPEAPAEIVSKGRRKRRVHMANERTFLAWIRTSVAIMAFGFVVEKFSLFVKQMAYYLGKESSPASRLLVSYRDSPCWPGCGDGSACFHSLQSSRASN